MYYEVTIKMRINSRVNKNRVESQMESLFEFGTIREAIAEGLKLGTDPRLACIEVEPISKDRLPAK